MEEGAPRRGVTPTAVAAQVCEALNAERARYLVIGGIACILHGHVRATTDVDILIEGNLKNATAVLTALSGVGYGFAREWRAEEILARPITVIGDDPAVDIFTVAWSVKYAGAVGRAMTVKMGGIEIPVMASTT